MVSEQATSEQIEQVPTDDARQCSGCHRRNSDLTLFENGKLYCSSCAEKVARLGIEPVVRADRSTTIAERGAPADALDHTIEHGDEHDHDADGDAPDDDARDDDDSDSDNADGDEEQVMASQPVQPNEIAAMPSLAPSSDATLAPAPPPSADVSLHGLLRAERARLLEQRSGLERQFRADVEAIDVRLAHVESLLDDGAEALAS